MKLLALFFLCLPIVSLAQDQNGCPTDADKNYQCGNIEETILERLDHLDYTWKPKIVVDLQHNFTRSKDIQRAEAVAQLVEQVLNDSDFWKAVEHYDHYTFAKWSLQFTDLWQPIAQQDITNALLNGDPKNDRRATQQTERFIVRLYGRSFKWRWENAIGKVKGNKIYTKKWFFRKSSIAEIGSNWVHEWSHLKGLRHCRKCHKARDYSVPYVINRIFMEIAQKYQ